MSPTSLFFRLSHPDYLGSIEWVTNADGRPVEYFWYSPWGETLHEDNSWRGRFRSPFKFTGHVEDEETGLTYAGARYYPARVGKWLSVDPMYYMSPTQTPYHYCSNNPVMRIDTDGRNDDEWNVNIETGEVTWVSDLGGDEVQVINYVDSEGRMKGVSAIEGAEAYVGKTRDGWAAASYNLWEGLSEGYNSKSGYEYSFDDLKMRHFILNSKKSYHGFATTIKNNEASGAADAITGSDYWKHHGHTLGNLLLMEFYITNADGLLSAEGINGMKRGKISSFGNFNLAPKQQQVPSSFSVFLQSQKGVDIGKYPGPGNWMKAQAAKYQNLKK